MDEIIELIKFKNESGEGLWNFYPAHKNDFAIFMHCAGTGYEYLARGGVMKCEYIDLIIPLFNRHGVRPVIVDKEKATWDYPVFHMPKQTEVEVNNATEIPSDDNKE